MHEGVPLVSVLMPAYNSAEFISIAIESILNQTYRDFEFIIIDDGSTDGTWGIVQDYSRKDKRIVAMRNAENLRTTVTLNRGIEVARGKYLIRMDADDWSYPYRIEEQIRFMELNLDVVAAGGSIEVCRSNLEVINKRHYPETDAEIRKKIFRYNPFAHPSVILRTDVVKLVGSYNKDIHLTQDYDLYFRLGRVGKFANLDQVLIKLRTHPQSSSMSKEKEQELIAVYIRFKAYMEYGYKMTLADKIYTLTQWISIFFIPGKVKFWLFNFYRKFISD